jgi:putative peptidoglycan lipid II flippase
VTGPPADDDPTLQLPQIAKVEPSLGRSSSLMALASMVSRITGFVRQVALFTVLGDTILNDSYTMANTLPLIVYEALIGGTLSSIMIPLLVRAQGEDRDGGESYTRKLLTLAGAALLAATALGMLAAPLLTRLYLGTETTGTADPQLATTLAYLLLPQIAFFGLGALLGAILNSRGAFGAFAWAPVLNNLVVIGVIAAYLVVPDSARLLVLGLGTTLGIVVQTLVLIPAVRRVGFRYRPQWGWDPRLTQAAGLAVWTVAYVLIGQAGLAVTTRVASSSAEGAITIYTNAWLLLQVPYGVLGVSLITALMPRMSRAAAEGRTNDLAADLSLGGRLASALLVPVAVLFTVFGTEIGVALFGLRHHNLDGATTLGTTLAVSAFGLLPFALTMLQMRAFHALTESRTATLIQLFMVVVKIPMLLACPLVLAPEDVVLGLAASNSSSFVAGALVGQLLLRRRLGRAPAGTWSTAGRVLLAAIAGVLAAVGVVALLDAGPFTGLSPQGRAWMVLLVAVVVGGSITLAGMRLLRVPEVRAVTRLFEGLVNRRKLRRGLKS